MTVATHSAVADAPGVPAAAARDAGRLGMWIFLVTDSMGFGGLLAAHAAMRARALPWPTGGPERRLSLPAGLALTALLVLSGATMAGAVRAGDDATAASAVGPAAEAISARLRRRRAWLWATVALGLTFLVVQAWEYRHLLGVTRWLPASDHAAALFFVLTGYHALHVAVGVAVLAGLAVASSASAGVGGPLPPSAQAQAAMGAAATTSARRLGIAALYWQFVDLVWLILFPLFYLPFGATTTLVRVAVTLAAGVAVTFTLLGPMRLGREARGTRLMIAGTLLSVLVMVAVLVLEFAWRARGAGLSG